MKISLALAGAVLLGSSLAACGGGDSDGASGGGDGDYCKDVKTASKTFGSLKGGDVGGIGDAFATFHKLSDEAPSAVKDDWKTLDGAITTIEKGFKDAGLKLSDLDELQAGKVPPGVDVSKLTTLAAKMNDLGSEKFTAASDAITKHAKDKCGVDLKAS